MGDVLFQFRDPEGRSVVNDISPKLTCSRDRDHRTFKLVVTCSPIRGKGHGALAIKKFLEFCLTND